MTLSRNPGSESLIRVAAVQTRAVTGETKANNAAALDAVHAAIDAGAQVLVLPELGNSGYMFDSRQEAFSLAEPIDGPTVSQWAKVAHQRKVWIAGGFTEIDNGRLYNSAALVGPDGPIGRYRKLHLWDEEQLFFEPGNLGLPVFDLPFGRVGMMICYDGWFPEVARTLKLKGADLILDPTCWVLVPGVVTPENPVSAYLHMASAHVNNMFIVCADQCGIERGCTFLGRSAICGPSGFIGGPAAFETTETVMAEINVVAARYHAWTALANPFANRRTDLYAQDLGWRDPADGKSAYLNGAN